ncbi:ABC transporter permease [Luedemannella flava]|uniref:ABC transporter permease n=1 Tax=Luedemannella flava TaxID=349316 RepID=A0ABP4YQ54_9ACTN
MTTTVVDEAPHVVVRPGFWTRERRTGAVLVVLGLLAAVVFGLLAHADASAKFVLSENAEGPSFSIPGRTGAIAFGLIVTVAGVLLLALSTAKRWFGLLVGVAVVALVFSLLCSQISAASEGLQFMPVVNVTRQSIGYSVPLVFGALAGVLCERTGVINVAIEGQLLLGAFSAAMFATIAASVWVGVIAGGAAGVAVGALLAFFAIRYRVDQVILGVILIVLCTGLTGFMFERFMASDAETYNAPAQLPVWEIPVLGGIPVLGPILFRWNALVYFVFIVGILIHFGLFGTRWGLRTRSVGEHPTAADTVGIRVLGLRYWNVLVAGLIAGIGGSYLVLDAGFQFSKGMSAGKGFIALAAMIFGRWNPVGAMLAALLFGFVEALQTFLSAIGSPIPSQFLSMAPYLITIVAVAGLVGRVRAPAADGKPYVKG